MAAFPGDCPNPFGFRLLQSGSEHKGVETLPTLSSHLAHNFFVTMVTSRLPWYRVNPLGTHSVCSRV